VISQEARPVTEYKDLLYNYFFFKRIDMDDCFAQFGVRVAT